VATDVVGNRDVIRHGVTGYVGGNGDELLAHVRALMADAPLRRRIGGQARAESLTRFSIERVVDDLERLYGVA
jgi:glycosyltransferase involved in cell wall biosynthesis